MIITLNRLWNLNITIIFSKLFIEEWRSENKKEVGELVFDFVDYYANCFNPFRDQIIIAKGLALQK